MFIPTDAYNVLVHCNTYILGPSLNLFVLFFWILQGGRRHDQLYLPACKNYNKHVIHISPVSWINICLCTIVIFRHEFTVLSG
jgi:hypothetical protein